MWSVSSLLKRSARPLLENTRAFHASPLLLKRRDGASASVVKTPRQFSKTLTKQEKKKRDISRGHKDHVGRMRDMKRNAQSLAKQEAAFTAFEQDEELLKEYDLAYDEIANSGRHRDYLYEDVMDVTLRDLNPADVAAEFYRLKPKDQTTDLLNELMRVYAIHKMPDATDAILSQLEAQDPTQPIPASVAAPSSMDVDASELVVVSKQQKLSPRLQADERTYVYHISALAETKQAAKAVRVLGRMKERGVPVTQQTYNAVMQACARSGRPDWAYNMFEKMQTAGIKPSMISFTILMNASIAVGDLDRAFETFHLMRSYVSQPSLVSFNSLIHGYAKIGRVERCINLMEDMLDLRITPNHVTYVSLIHACSKSHYYAHKAWEFFYEMQDNYDILPCTVTYSYMLNAAARHGDIRSAEKLVHLMTKHAVPQTPAISISLVNVYARAQIKSVVRRARCNIPPPEPLEPIISREKTEWGDDGNIIDLDRPGKQNVFSDHNMGYDEEMDEDYDDELDENYDNVEYGDDGDDTNPIKTKGLTKEEQEILKQYVVNRKPIVLPKTFNVGNQIQEAQDPAEVDSLAWNPMPYEEFNQFQNSNRDKAIQIYDTCLSVHGPSLALLNTMLSVHTNALRLQTAREFVDTEFAKHGLTPDVFTYRSLMRMYTRAKRPHMALALVHELHDRGVKPDASFYGYLVDYFACQRKLRSAMEVLEEMDRHGLRLDEKNAYVLRKLIKKYGVYTELVSEDPNAIHSMSHHDLMEMRRERAAAIADNKKYNRKFYIPRRSEEYM
ncbi:Aste57867_20173 [Aphanomyces stellatus]|uniref:Aste57867_20173 protein n=1 Tax=Aphanomyces stellatus TaxID=120398 RepID=A0A485LFW0_9STRA|nr:hypothetical protein As57867_020107 [Aphanomyces stellatus]VFT96867.1 Aste57867_20173 [Aphanomyces stellatus]